MVETRMIAAERDVGCGCRVDGVGPTDGQNCMYNFSAGAITRLALSRVCIRLRIALLVLKIIECHPSLRQRRPTSDSTLTNAINIRLFVER